MASPDDIYIHKSIEEGSSATTRWARSRSPDNKTLVKIKRSLPLGELLWSSAFEYGVLLVHLVFLKDVLSNNTNSVS